MMEATYTQTTPPQTSPLPSPKGEGVERGEGIELNAFTAWLMKKARSDSTIQSYLSDVRLFLRWMERHNGGHIDLNKISGVDCRLYHQFSTEIERVAPGTWNRRHSSLSLLADWLLETGAIVWNPMQSVPREEEQPLAPRWLNEAEFRRLLRAVENDVNSANTALRRRRALRDAALVALMLLGGLRESEVIALRNADLEISERSGAVTIRSGKGNKTRRVKLSLEARRMILPYIAERQGAPLDHLIVDEDGRPLLRRAVQKRIARLGELAHIEGLTPHRLRHTYVKRLLDSGENTIVVMSVAGHNSEKTTRRYGLPGEEDLERAAEGAVLGSSARFIQHEQKGGLWRETN